MKLACTPCLFVLCVLAPEPARADAVTFTTALSTVGSFDCRSSFRCSGEGTSSITFGSGANTGTLTFTGVDTTIDVTNRARPVVLGSFELSATDGFTSRHMPQIQSCRSCNSR
jgi:hypothetical protein